MNAIEHVQFYMEQNRGPLGPVRNPIMFCTVPEKELKKVMALAATAIRIEELLEIMRGGEDTDENHWLLDVAYNDLYRARKDAKEQYDLI